MAASWMADLAESIGVAGAWGQTGKNAIATNSQLRY
jgi:hypothetical protein